MKTNVDKVHIFVSLPTAAMMQIQNVFVTPSNQKIQAAKAKRKFSVEEGDHITMLNVFNAFMKYNKSSRWCHEYFLNYKGLVRAVEIREQLVRLLRKFNIKLLSSNGEVKPILRCITSGKYSIFQLRFK